MKHGLVFPFGSYVYGTYGWDSDRDFILIGSTKSYIEGCDSQFYTHAEFQELIDQHEISALECLWLGVDHSFEFELNLSTLRSSISAKASNSWVKAKKKINQGDVRIGQKSLFHSLRILMFGCQIAKYGKIVNYQCANRYWDIIKQVDSWEELDNIFRKRRNRLNSKFRLLAPKGNDNA